MKVEFPPESIEDLSRLREFIQHKNPLAARRISAELLEGIERLKQFPQIGLTVMSAQDPEKIRDLILGHCTVRYLLTEQIIFILRVWHNKENERTV